MRKVRRTSARTGARVGGSNSSNPKKSDTIAFSERDRLIVLAED